MCVLNFYMLDLASFLLMNVLMMRGGKVDVRSTTKLRYTLLFLISTNIRWGALRCVKLKEMYPQALGVVSAR
jgi:hypothetical protein